MSEQFKGFIKKINARPVQTARGPSTSYSVKIADQDGNEVEQWFSAGFKAPAFKEGDYVAITAEQNDRGYWNITGHKSLKNPPARASKAGAAGVGGELPPSTASHIHYQNSRTAAIQTIDLLLENDALPMSSAKTAAGTAKRYEEIMALVDKLTVRFFYDVETLRKTKSVADEGAEVKDVGSLPEDDEDDVDEEIDEDVATD